MSLDDVKREFLEQVKLRAYDDKYVDKGEEREILQLALQRGITVDSARAALAQVCESNNFVLESAALAKVKEVLETFANNDGKIDEKEYTDAVNICKKATQGKKTDLECKKMVMKIIDEANYQPKTGWFSNWMSRTKKEIGMA